MPYSNLRILRNYRKPVKKILVAMSGGVDSSVAALLLKEEGYAVAGAYIKTWLNEVDAFGECPWQTEIDDAREVAERIAIKFSVKNFISEYRENVVQYLVSGYRSGCTPNPDSMCNRKVKFGVFLKWALEEGYDGIATGHYCRKVDNPNGRSDLWEGEDKNKDQSYFLALLTQNQLRPALFPLGNLTKPEVRALALEHGFPNAAKKDSQGICFLGKVKIADFLRQYIPDQKGDIINPEGRKIGEHEGLHRYTLGQRKGIGIPSNADRKAYVVVGKNRESNQLIVDFDHREAPGLYVRKVILSHLSFLNQPLFKSRQLLAKPRYRDPSCPVQFTPDNRNGGSLEFKISQRALAKGQICALYEGEKLLGGGFYE